MSEKSMYVNNFAVTGKDLAIVLETRATAPNIETSTNGVAALFGQDRIVDEDFLYIPIPIAKELALALVRVLSEHEKRLGLKFSMAQEKEDVFSKFVEALNSSDIYQ